MKDKRVNSKHQCHGSAEIGSWEPRLFTIHYLCVLEYVVRESTKHQRGSDYVIFYLAVLSGEL